MARVAPPLLYKASMAAAPTTSSSRLRSTRWKVCAALITIIMNGDSLDRNQDNAGDLKINTFNHNGYKNVDLRIYEDGAPPLPASHLGRTPAMFESLADPEAVVFKKMRVTNSRAELLVRRLRQWQRYAAYPDDSRQSLATIFGILDGLDEEATAFLRDGSMSPTANPWAQQVQEDLQAPGYLEGGPAFLEAYS
ncbi:unnamed protein product, partial [Prorocentrum cordatum]